VKAEGGYVVTFGMLSRLVRGEHMPIFSFLLIISDLLPILTGLGREFFGLVSRPVTQILAEN